MIVAIDTNCIIPGRVGGIENYTLGLIEALKLPQSPAMRVFLLTRPENQALFASYKDARTSTLIVDRPQYDGAPVSNWAALFATNPVQGSKLLAEHQKRKIDLLHQNRVELVHFPGNTINPLDIGLPAVLNLHDLQFRHFPQYYTTAELEHRETFWVQAAQRADSIVVASNFIREDFQQQLGVEPGKLFVTPEPFQAKFHARPTEAQLKDLRRRLKVTEKFFFYPAVPWEHKNHRRLIGAFLQANLPGAQLVLSGGGQDDSALGAIVADLGAENEIRLVGRVTTDDLIGLYHLATAMVFPSQYEAWSIPIMEAMACGCPVASSNATSLAEEVGDAGILFDPEDTDEMTYAMQKLWANDALRKQLSNHGLERVQAFAPERFLDVLSLAYTHARSAHGLRRAA